MEPLPMEFFVTFPFRWLVSTVTPLFDHYSLNKRITLRGREFHDFLISLIIRDNVCFTLYGVAVALLISSAAASIASLGLAFWSSASCRCFWMISEACV